MMQSFYYKNADCIHTTIQSKGFRRKCFPAYFVKFFHDSYSVERMSTTKKGHSKILWKASVLKRFVNFYHIYGCSKANFRPLKTRQPHSPDVSQWKLISLSQIPLGTCYGAWNWNREPSNFENDTESYCTTLPKLGRYLGKYLYIRGPFHIRLMYVPMNRCQKESFADTLQIGVLKNLAKSTGKQTRKEIPKNDSNTDCEFYEIFEIIFFTEYLRKTASVM